MQLAAVQMLIIQCLLSRVIVRPLACVGNKFLNVPALNIVLLVPYRKWKCFLLLVDISDLKDGYGKKKTASYFNLLPAIRWGDLLTSGLGLYSIFLFSPLICREAGKESVFCCPEIATGMLSLRNMQQGNIHQAQGACLLLVVIAVVTVSIVTYIYM